MQKSKQTNISGKIYLIGAGPGDAELLTMKAARVLQESDVILIDDLVNREVLKYARADAQILTVGKRSGNHKAKQKQINETMLHFVNLGKIVSRLKGGDPCVFGRGGEELMEMRAYGVPVEIISGVTAGIAVPAALGIPVTHRQLSRSVLFISGHSCDPEHQPNWQAIVETKATIVIYMGVKNLSEICTSLIAAGLPSFTPACAIQNGTLSNQVTVCSTVEELPQQITKNSIAAPAIIVIGEVVSLSEENFISQEISCLLSINPKEQNNTRLEIARKAETSADATVTAKVLN